MYEYFLAALAFGLSAGMQPGPLTVIILHQTLTQGLAAGLRACLAPIFSDGPIILITTLALPHLESISGFTTLLNLTGGLYLLAIARSMAVTPPLPAQQTPCDTMTGSLSTAIRINLLNPYPYLFWFTVGGGYILRGTQAQALVFITTAITTLITTKMGVALLASRCQPFLSEQGHRLLTRLLATSLALFGILGILRPFSA
ncbi:MAG: LysE family transporter [Magnetococcales bacterium]|nr:LysE family transporter [Magnetococcales bacterium]